MDEPAKTALWAQERWLRARLNDWDPIAASPPADEYDCILWPTLRLLRQGSAAEEIARYLAAELTDHFGIGAPDDPPPLAFAQALLDGFEAVR